MKSIATLALIGLAAASQDNEFFKSNNSTRVELTHHNHTQNATVRPHPIHHIPTTHNTTVKPKPHRALHPLLFNRTQPVHPKTKEWLNPKGTNALKKVLTSFDDDELWNVDNTEASDDELTINYFSKVGSFVGKNKSAVVPIATKIVGHWDDESTDSELSKIGDVLSKGVTVVKKLGGNLDDEFSADELAFLGSLTRVVQKSTPTISTINRRANPLLALDDEELFNIDALLNDAIRTYNDARHSPRNYGDLVNDGIQIVKDIKQKKDDEELFNIAGLIGDGLNIYQDVKTHNYNGIVNHGIQTVKDIKKRDDEELFNLDAFLNDAVKTYNDARQTPRNYGNLVNDGIQIVKDIKQKKDDEELFNLGGLINDGLHIYNDVKTHNYGGLVNDGIQTVKDVKEATHGKKFLRH